jgi:phosphate transport system substrate-binding protein
MTNADGGIMKRMKIIAILAVTLLLLTGCGYSRDMIDVVSREDGSGTRGAFSELFKITEKQEDGSVLDNTYERAEVTNSTAVVMLTVSEDVNAIGYISMGSLNDSVKAVDINGVAPTAADVKNGSYQVSRPFLIAIRDNENAAVRDFIDFILSSDGQKVVEDMGYVSSEDGSEADYQGNPKAGKITVAGSSSVTPVMEALKEAYIKINPQVEIEIQQSDSTTGMTSVVEGIADIGMSSRELKSSETSRGIIPYTIAYDGLAVIVNPENPVNNLTKEQVYDIFTGKITSWSEIGTE